MEIDSRELKKILAEQQEQMEEKFERHVGALIEHTDSRFDAAFDYAQSIGEKVDKLEGRFDGLEKKVDKLEQRQDIIFDKVGEIAEDVTIIKETVQDHERKFRRVEFKK